MFDFLKKKIKELTRKDEPENQPTPTKTKEIIEPKEPAKLEEPIKPEEPIIRKQPKELSKPHPLPEPTQKEKPSPPKPKKKTTQPKPKSITQQLTSVFKGKDLEETLWELELALLEADVAKPVAEEICEKVRKTGGRNIETTLKNAIKDILSVQTYSITERAKQSKKPFKIMFLGPNGAGKTLTLAKIATLLQKNGLSCIFAAGDTFRAASIEQLEEHANKLGVRVVKQAYGADPAAVAFDAVKSAEANDIDCVLIDTAGRQDNNQNLMEELKKINRVVQPDLRIYVDEALSGNVLPERALKFKEAVGVDGVILTKMDTDVKGGGAISIAHMIKTPILFFGVGQDYDNLEPFNADVVLANIFD
ncbi:signal recognition particle-docking protein FtsY [archaeon]|nr:signal recognition particle-docking protein FtsY [archaeon]